MSRYAHMVGGPHDGAMIRVKTATPIITFRGGVRYRRTGEVRAVEGSGETRFEYEYVSDESPETPT